MSGVIGRSLFLARRRMMCGETRKQRCARFRGSRSNNPNFSQPCMNRCSQDQRAVFRPDGKTRSQCLTLNTPSLCTLSRGWGLYTGPRWQVHNILHILYDTCIAGDAHIAARDPMTNLTCNCNTNLPVKRRPISSSTTASSIH